MAVDSLSRQIGSWLWLPQPYVTSNTPVFPTTTDGMQGGRQEFEIGVAYNKVGQKYPNKDIFEASGQKARRPDGRMTG